MNIRKAILEDQKIQKGITREVWMPGGPSLIPTNTTSCFILIPYKSEDLGKRWNPTAEDILAHDWYVTN